MNFSSNLAVTAMLVTEVADGRALKQLSILYTCMPPYVHWFCLSREDVESTMVDDDEKEKPSSEDESESAR